MSRQLLAVPTTKPLLSAEMKKYIAVIYKYITIRPFWVSANPSSSYPKLVQNPITSSAPRSLLGFYRHSWTPLEPLPDYYPRSLWRAGLLFKMDFKKRWVHPVGHRAAWLKWLIVHLGCVPLIMPPWACSRVPVYCLWHDPVKLQSPFL